MGGTEGAGARPCGVGVGPGLSRTPGCVQRCGPGGGKPATVSSGLERSRFRGPAPAQLSLEKCFDRKKP